MARYIVSRQSPTEYVVWDTVDNRKANYFIGRDAKFYAEIDAVGRNEEIDRASVNDDGTPEDTEVDAAYAAHLDGLWSQSLTLAR